MAFVEKELRSGETSESGLTEDLLFEKAERLVVGLTPAGAFGAGQGDVGVERTSLGDESAKRRGCYDPTGESDEFGSSGDIGKEDAGAFKEAQFSQMNRDGFRTHFAEARDEALVLFMIRVAQELERDVPGCGLCPAQAVAARPEPGHYCREFGKNNGPERDADEQTHTQIV